jgi:hypothetical protein
MAGPIDIEIAKKVANNFMNSRRSYSKILNIVSEYYNNEISFYVINFVGGGWVMVSSDDRTVPILGFGLEGEYRLEDSKPGGFIALTDQYKKQIQNSRTINQKNSDVTKKWDNLINSSFEDTKSNMGLVGGLLNVPGRGQVQWSQSLNNSGGCTPAYNTFSPSGSGENCDCDRKDAGCGAVAMGQIMWYYQWPLSSLYRSYEWNNMPNEVTNSTPMAQGDEVAHLLRDLGDAADFTYLCSGTFPIGGTNYIVNGFNTFGYSGVKKHVKEQWEYGTAWSDLIRSEIDNNRPVFYRGDQSDLSTHKHFWVIDGYDSLDPDYFYCNFGWGYPGNTYNISYQYLDDMTPGDHDFNENQQLISGISPTLQSSLPWDINDVAYTAVYTTIVEAAENDISLPASPGKTLSVENGGDLTLIAGNNIILNPGFEVKAGGKFAGTIDPSYTGNNVDITLPGWTNVFTPNGDGINDNLVYVVENADSWEFEAFDLSGTPIFQSAGSIFGTNASVWDGTGALYSHAYYPCIIRFKNSFGRAIENAYMVYVAFLTKSGDMSDDIKTPDMNNASPEDKAIDINYKSSEDGDSTIEVYPNPSQGNFSIRSLDDFIQGIKIFNTSGTIIYNKRGLNQNEISVNIGGQPNGVYHVHIYRKDQVVTKKIIKN